MEFFLHFLLKSGDISKVFFFSFLDAEETQTIAVKRKMCEKQKAIKRGLTATATLFNHSLFIQP